MIHIFHQNMKQYGGVDGGRWERTERYIPEMLRLKTRYRNTIQVAGFTEITNNISAAAGLGRITGALFGDPDPGRSHSLFLTACGTSALRTVEYLGIGVKDPCKVNDVLRVVIKEKNTIDIDLAPKDEHGDLDLNAAAFKKWCITLPKGYLADYRFIVFITVEIDDDTYLVGFIHNVFRMEINRATFMGLLPDMLKAIPLRPVYLGGDFNVAARDLGSARGRNYYKCYKKGMMLPPNGRDPKFKPGGTLESGNLYDYWYSDVIAPATAGAVPRPDIYEGTLFSSKKYTLSDHCGIVLQIA